MPMNPPTHKSGTSEQESEKRLDEGRRKLTFEEWMLVHDPYKVVSYEGKEVLRECWKAAQENV